jgi:hypothetical protein
MSLLYFLWEKPIPCNVFQFENEMNRIYGLKYFAFHVGETEGKEHPLLDL